MARAKQHSQQVSKCFALPKLFGAKANAQPKAKPCLSIRAQQILLQTTTRGSFADESATHPWRWRYHHLLYTRAFQAWRRAIGVVHWLPALVTSAVNAGASCRPGASTSLLLLAPRSYAAASGLSRSAKSEKLCGGSGNRKTGGGFKFFGGLRE